MVDDKTYKKRKNKTTQNNTKHYKTKQHKTKQHLNFTKYCDIYHFLLIYHNKPIFTLIL